ncbi:MAG TPA: GDP-mannose 4,6-dehydratase [Patescibacteria group bacterium]|nr:GDP-mannose 4,6-dehydratase [Patescibacteria group bacterium]
MNKFWNNKKVLVTGGTGFIGSNLTDHLLNLGAKVYVLENTRRSKSKKYNKHKTGTNKKNIPGDICDKEFIDKLFKKESFDLCFHLAARPLVLEGRENENPLSTFNVNIIGTLNILEAVRIYKTKGLVIASTAHVYGQAKPPFLEEHLPKTSRPYETSKVCADILAQTYNKYYNLPVAIARFVNIYGPGDNNKRIIPKTIKLILQNKSPELYDNQTKRSYLYVEDAVRGYVALAEKINQLAKKNSNIIYNFGTEKIYSTKNIIDMILSLMKRSDIRPTIVKGAREKEVVSQYVSIEKAKKNLNWRPKIPIKKGLLETIAWHKKIDKF